MDENQTPWVKGEELQRVITEPRSLTPKLRGLARTEFAHAFHKERGCNRGGSNDWLIDPKAVQYLLDKKRLLLHPETDAPGKHTPSPNAFLERYGLRRPLPKDSAPR